MRKPPIAILGTPSLLTAKELKKLETSWDEHPKAQRLIRAHITDPVALAAIEEVRDGYFQLFSERRYLQRMLREDPLNETLEKRLEDVNYDLVLHNHKSFKRFTYPGYGVAVARQREIFDGDYRPEHSGNPMTAEEAKKIIAPIIGASIDCFEGLNRFYQIQKTPRMTVPGQASLYASPDMLNKKRTISRKSWVDGFKDIPDPSSDRTR